MALGLAAATITGGLFLQPHGATQDVTANPASLRSSRVTPKAASPTPSGLVGAQATATPASEITSSDSTPTASESATTESSSTGTPTSSASESPTATISSVSRGSGDRSPLNTPVASHQSPETGSATPQQVSEGSSGQNRSDAEINGWSVDYFEGFDGSFEDTKWGHYGWKDPEVGHGAMGVMSQKNSFVENGHLVIRTQYQDGQWSAGGASSADAFAASRGRWEVRAKFPRGKGIGYAFLLWPEDKSWPPEIDFAEGRVNGPRVSGTYHWGDSTEEGHKQDQRVFDNTDMGGWHTYGVIVEDDYIVFTFDGQEWGRITRDDVGEGITDKRMWFGVQTGAMDPNGKANQYETVDGGVPGPLTPAVSDIQIDYVAHYTRG